MPVHKADGGYQWGHKKVYKGKGAKAKAAKQGSAIKANQAKKAKRKTARRGRSKPKV